MAPRASWISVALFALTSAALMGFLGCSSSRTIPSATSQQSKIMAPSLHAKMARQQAGLPAVPQSKLVTAKVKSAKLNLKVKRTTRPVTQNSTQTSLQ